MTYLKKIGLILVFVVGLFVCFWIWARQTAFDVPARADLEIQGPSMPVWDGQKPLRIMSWNIEFLAGKDFIFFFDLLNGQGPDEQTTPEARQKSLRLISAAIQQQQPDILLLQEVDQGAERTDHEDELGLLIEALQDSGWQMAQAFYWKHPFVPHPRIMGSVGMKLVVLSKYQLRSATWWALPQIPYSTLVRGFQIQRGTIEVRLPTRQGKEVAVLNTHWEPFDRSGDIKNREMEWLRQKAHEFETEGIPWILGGDLNILQAGEYERIPAEERSWFLPEVFLDIPPHASVFPSAAQLAQDSLRPSLLTHFPNRPGAMGVDKTIDFFLWQGFQVQKTTVLREGVERASDHRPLLGEFYITSES